MGVVCGIFVLLTWGAAFLDSAVWTIAFGSTAVVFGVYAAVEGLWLKYQYSLESPKPKKPRKQEPQSASKPIADTAHTDEHGRVVID